MTGSQAALTQDDPFQIGTSPRNAVPGIASWRRKAKNRKGERRPELRLSARRCNVEAGLSGCWLHRTHATWLNYAEEDRNLKRGVLISGCLRIRLRGAPENRQQMNRAGDPKECASIAT
jgi:hypothetical protein